jgi:hypothetical protein
VAAPVVAEIKQLAREQPVSKAVSKEASKQKTKKKQTKEVEQP